MHSGIHSSTDRAARRRLAYGATEHAIDRDTSGPAPIGDYLPKLRLRVRTIPTLVWRDGAWRVEWIVLSYPELVHVASRSVERSITTEGRRA